MAYANDTFRRVLGVAGRSEADFRGQASRKGYCLLKGSARWAARSWLRRRRKAMELPSPDERSSDMPLEPMPALTFRFSPPRVIGARAAVNILEDVS